MRTSLSKLERSLLAYRLAGHDARWRDAGERRFAQYTSLGPGKYKFEVMARDPAGLWSESAALAFGIKPQFHETWLFYSGCSLAMLLLVSAVQRYRLVVQRRILELQQENAIARERTRIAQDMHDDLGSSLTRIKMLSEVARLAENDSARLKQRLDQISTVALEVTRDMDEIVWAINPRYDLLDDLATYFARYAEEFLRESRIRCHLAIPEELPRIFLSAERRHKLFLIFKESLNNVVKHSRATEVWIRFDILDNDLGIEIRDNGTGLPGEIDNSRHGLTNIRDRINQIGGQLQLDSDFGGTTVRCSVRLS